MKMKPMYINEEEHGNRFKGNSDYLSQLRYNNSNVYPIEDYQGANIEILHECIICGNIYFAKPHNILRGKSKCKKCKDIQKHFNFIDKVKNVNPNIEILGFYITTNNKIHVRCKKCGYEWYPYGTALESYRECQNCGKVKNTCDEKDFFRKVYKNNQNIKILSPYSKVTGKYKCQCNVCNSIWEIDGGNLSRGKSGCRECYRINKRLTRDIFLMRINQINPSIIPLDQYVDSDTYMNFYCENCNNIWRTKPKTILFNKSGCPNCNDISKGEKQIKMILDKYNILYTYQKPFKELKGVGDRPLSYDFHLIKLNKLIEYQGQQHENPIKYFGGKEKFEIQQEHDRRKREYAKEHNIDLIEIWYYDYDNIEEILKKELKLESVETVTVA